MAGQILIMCGCSEEEEGCRNQKEKKEEEKEEEKKRSGRRGGEKERRSPNLLKGGWSRVRKKEKREVILCGEEHGSSPRLLQISFISNSNCLQKK